MLTFDLEDPTAIGIVLVNKYLDLPTDKSNHKAKVVFINILIVNSHKGVAKGTMELMR